MKFKAFWILTLLFFSLGVISGCVDNKPKQEAENTATTETAIASTTKSTEISKSFKMGDLLPSSVIRLEYTDEISIRNNYPAETSGDLRLMVTALCCPPEKDFERAQFDIEDNEYNAPFHTNEVRLSSNQRVIRSRDKSSFINWQFGDRNSFKIRSYEGFDIYIPSSDYNAEYRLDILLKTTERYYPYEERYIPIPEEDVVSYVEIQDYIIVGKLSELLEIIDSYKRGDVLNKKKAFNELLNKALDHTGNFNRLWYSESSHIEVSSRLRVSGLPWDRIAELHLNDYFGGTQVELYKFANESEAKKFAWEKKKAYDEGVESVRRAGMGTSYNFEVEVEKDVVIFVWSYKEK